MQSKADRFLWQSKINYMKGITPSNEASINSQEYKAIVDIGKEYIENNQLEEFSFFFMETQYFIPLWTAHIILEHGNPEDKLKKECLDIILEYSEHPINDAISRKEKEWLKANLKRFL
jgi:hypothetical protein